MEEIKLGFYRYYEGELYLVEFIANHTETLEEFVVYKSLTKKVAYWVSPLSMFKETVKVNGEIVPKFTRLSEKESNELSKRFFVILPAENE